MTKYSPETRALAWVLYLVAVPFFTSSLLEVAVSSYPVRFGDPVWRVGALGLLSQGLTVPVLGLFAALAAAILLEQRAVQAMLGFLFPLMAVVIAVALITFALDAIQIRRSVASGRERNFDVVLLRGLFLMLCSLIALIVGAIQSWRIRKATAPEVAATGFLIGKRPAAGGKA